MDNSWVFDKEPLDIPKVRVFDAYGKVVGEGYYFAFPARSGYPIIEDGEKPDVITLREGIVTYDPGDWGLPNRQRFMEVTPPHRIEVIEEVKK